MNIDPDIMHRHLREAGVEQVRLNFQRQGYSIEQAESGLDVVARLGSQTVAAQVKVLGAGVPSGSLATAMTEARRLGASFRLFVIKPERDILIEVDNLGESLLEAAREKGAETLGFPSGWTIDRVDDIRTDHIAVHGEEIRVSGQAQAVLRGNAEEEGAAFTFTLLLGAGQIVLRGSDIEPLDD